ncbi:ferritin-like domain-containing protein, partial [Russula compacta]
SLGCCSCPLAVSAVPVRRGTDPATLQVLQYAFTLEQLETQFYSQILSKFSASDFASAGFVLPDAAIEQFKTIESHESTHASTIQGIITGFGEKPISGCKFDVSSMITDLPTTLMNARVVEDVGVGAYLGAAHLIEDPRILTDAASILTIEARHQTMLNVLNNGTAVPEAFDIPLLPQEVLSIAGGFISGCDLGIHANAPLSLTNTGSITVGTSLEFESPAISSTSGLYCQLLTGGQAASTALPMDKCVVPDWINGPVAILITSNDEPLNGNVVDRYSQSVVAGPVITFIDTHTDLIDGLVWKNSNGATA